MKYKLNHSKLKAIWTHSQCSVSWCMCVKPHHFWRHLGSQVMDGLSEDTNRGENKHNPEDDTCSADKQAQRRMYEDYWWCNNLKELKGEQQHFCEVLLFLLASGSSLCRVKNPNKFSKKSHIKTGGVNFVKSLVKILKIKTFTIKITVVLKYKTLHHVWKHTRYRGSAHPEPWYHDNILLVTTQSSWPQALVGM